MSEWRFELRVRYSPDDLEDLYENDRFTYFFYYDQVKRFFICFFIGVISLLIKYDNVKHIFSRCDSII